MKLRKLSKNDVCHLRFQVQFDFDLKAFRMDEYSTGLTLLVPFAYPFMDSDSCETPPFGRYDLVKEGYVFSHAVFHRFGDGRLDVEYIYTLDLPDSDEDNIIIPSVSHLVLEKQLQSMNFQGYYKKVLQVLRLIQRYE